MRSAAILFIAAALGVTGCASIAPSSVREQTQRYSQTITLDAANETGRISLEEVLADRRSTRNFSSTELDMSTIGRLLWAGQGITDDAGHRTAPSAGATYPIELYALTAATFMHYLPDSHQVEQRPDSQTLRLLADAAFDQGFVNDAPTVLVITGVVSRTEAEYGAVANDFMNREAGHVAQNILLQATALSLAAVPVGGFEPAEVARLLALPPGEEVLYLIPVGHPASVGSD